MNRREVFRRRIPRYREDPCLFFSEVTGFKPDDWQREAAMAMVGHEKVTIRSGQGVGKTAFEANITLWFLTCHSFPRVVCTAPTFQQLNDVLWAEISKWQEKSSLLKELLVWTKTRVYMKGQEKRWFAVARTATKPENMQGFHEDSMLFIVDEASGIADPIMEAILGTLSGPNNKLLMCGNPTRCSGTFYDSHKSDADADVYYRIKVSSRDSVRTNKKNIEALERKFGKESNVVRVRVDGEFPESEDDVFIPMSIARNAMAMGHDAHLKPTRIAIGADIARFGDDDTALVVNIDRDIMKITRRHGQDLYATADDIIAMYQSLIKEYPRYHGSVYAIIDDTGLGGGVTDILNREKTRQKLGRLLVVPVNFSSAVPDKDAAKNYADICTWMWSLIRDYAQAGELRLPDDNELLGQLVSRKYLFQGTPAKIKLEGKKDLKARGLPSPDIADAIGLSLYTTGVFDVSALAR